MYKVVPDKPITVYGLLCEALGDIDLARESYNVPTLWEAKRNLERAIAAIDMGEDVYKVVRV